MILVIVCALLGCLLMIKRLRQCLLVYNVVRRRWKGEKPLYRVHTSRFSIISFTALCVLSLFIVFTNYQDPQLCALGTILTFISIGEIGNAIINNTFYYDEKGFYYYHTYMYFRDIKELKESKGLFGLITIYNVRTNKAILSVSKNAYHILSHKRSDIEQKCAK